ncbi:eclosion hormone [Athalia rosae]|uniref:eclosion hormone n=1 Tax=Athalia rosae TaxID=37344 RepID=UPI00062567F0|nr:eclosion hormone [Athalia rosae]XP_048512917.1 eclosion hormone [Athalia rosae]
MKNQTRVALLLFVVLAAFFITASAGSNRIGVCIRNCAQCKKMFGAYFEGQLCADTCVKFKGKIIPDCEDASSIAPFITKIDDE